MKKKNIIRSISLLIIFLLISAPIYSQTVSTENSIKIYINQELQDCQSFIINGRAMVPLRVIFEKLGGEVQWYPETRTVTVTREEDDISILLKINNSLAMIGSSPYTLDAPPLIIDGRTMIPLRFISESLGSEVTWDSLSRIVEIFTVKTAVKPFPQEVAGSLLKDLRIGMTINQAESILGSAKGVRVGPANSQLRSYHNNFSDYYLVSYKNNLIHYIYTSQVGAAYGTSKIGEKYTGFYGDAEYCKGSLTATFSPGNDKGIQISNGIVAISYLDKHEENTVRGIRIISAESLLSDTTILDYSLRYANSDDLPKLMPYAGSNSIKEIEVGQSSIHFELDNATRITHNMNIFSWNSSLAQVAYLHSKDMADNNYFSHTSLTGKSPFDRIKAGGITYILAAENLSWGERYYDAIESHHGLMNSLGHRKNILNPALRELGIGSSYNNGLYITQNFITR